jgi:hypothetical protein
MYNVPDAKLACKLVLLYLRNAMSRGFCHSGPCYTVSYKIILSRGFCHSGPCYTVSWPKAEVDQYSTEAMAIATTICSLLSLTVGCTLGYSVAMSRHSTVGDVINDAARPTTNWTTGSPSSYQRHVTTKSQLIAVLNERYSTADVTHELLRLQ